MKVRFEAIEKKLRAAATRWKLLLLTQRLAVVAGAMALACLLVGLGLVGGVITSRFVAGILYALIGIVGLAVMFVFLLMTMSGRVERNWVAAKLESVNSRLKDRLNTLVFLENSPRSSNAEAFALRIARQARTILRAKGILSPFPAARSFAHALVFIALLVLTIWFYQANSPWERLTAAETAKLIKPVEPEKAPDFSLPGTNSVEQQASWGEVRITEPGGDLKVTKVDVVPLQIEAAANEALKRVTWHSTLNGGAEKTNSLPPPAEPRYAVYQPTVYLDELQLSDWDVVTYHAKANTEKDHNFASQIYFLEVRPFREDILKMPGGEGGKAYQCLNELTGLIEEQQRVIRETHKFAQQPAGAPNLRDQDRGKLAAAETDLSQSAEHLYASMAAEMENKPIGEALDSLAKAEKTLDQAGKFLREDVMSDAQNRERQALAELVAARKMFQKAISDNPKDFEEPKPDDMPPVAEDSKKLKEMAEFRNEVKAAQDFVNQVKADQQKLGDQSLFTQPKDAKALAEKEKALQKSLQDFQQQHPQPFRNSEAESQQAQDAMNKAAEAFAKQPSATQKLNQMSQNREAAKEAADALQKLSEAVKNQSGEQQLTDAYKLRQMLDRQIEKFGQCANSPSSVPTDQLQKTASAARQTLDEMQKRAEQSPTREQFGQPLRDALSPEKKSAMDRQLGQLEQVRDDLRKKVLSGEAKKMLGDVSKAFEQSEPQAMQAGQKKDSLKPDSQDSFARGMAELQSLIQRLEQQRQTSKSDQSKQLGEALMNLRDGMPEPPGAQAQTAQVLTQLQQLQKGEMPMDAEVLKRLAQELQRYSWETGEQRSKQDKKPEVTNIDPNRLPPAYRGRIQKYFEKLSEK